MGNDTIASMITSIRNAFLVSGSIFILTPFTISLATEPAALTNWPLPMC